ncbi:uncharacterized protein LOC124698753 [Lolium rigidum]|uniref:uncharacterized protein LOC124698753 n=1 Tax=Lolium rigidum TaxID=89674 RepID=UPI001F5DEC25|nr:uncharacterized protein LOC124698753 [Lolium rigidum]
MYAGAASTSDELQATREASRRRLRVRASAARAQPTPLADVLREHALVHLTPAAAVRLRLVHPSWARRISSPLFAVAHAAAPRRLSGLFVPSAGFLPFHGPGDAVPSPSLSFAPASSDVTVLSSSHGVACCFSPADDALFVCNPATASWSAVPSPPCRTWPRPAVVVLFDATPYNFRGDYGLVCAAECAPGTGAYCFQVFTSGTGSWQFADAVAPAEGLVAASGVAAGGTAWWRTSVGTAVGYCPETGRVEVVLCPGDSAKWEIGSAGGNLHCAVRAGDGVAVYQLDEHGCWEVAAAWVPVEELLPRSQIKPAQHENAEGEAGGEELVAQSPVIVEKEVLELDDAVQLLGFQGTGLEVVVLAGRRLVAFDTETRRRREVRVPVRTEEKQKQWDGAEYAVHTNTLALIAPVVLAGEPVLVESPDDEVVAFP